MIRTTHERRGIFRLDLIVLLAIGLIGLGMILPVTHKIGCSSARLQSQQNLQVQHKIHAFYATDWNERQFTAVPDDLGVHGGDCAQWEAATGTEIPGLELGRSCGISTVGFYGCEWSAARNPIDFDMQFSSGLPLATFQKTAGAYRFPNAAPLNQYANGRYHDPIFWAPDDVWSLVGAYQYFDGKCGYDAPATEPVAASSYILSPAAMFHPDVFLDGNTWNDPRSFDEGFASPSVTACAYPELKTRLIEHNVVETCLPRFRWSGFHPMYEGSSAKNPAPCLFNHAPRGRPLALFFDGSVRIFTPKEARHSNERAERSGESSLWGRFLGSEDYFEGQSFGFNTDSGSHHLFTTGGITGRDTLDTSNRNGGTP